MNLLLQISAYGIIITLAQFFISNIIFFFRMRKEEVLYSYRIPEKIGKGYVLKGIRPMIIISFYIIFILAIATVVFLMVFLSKLYLFSIHIILLIIDIFVLLSIDKKILRQTIYYHIGWGQSLLKYPKKWMNFIFQPIWLILIFFLLVIISIIVR